MRTFYIVEKVRSRYFTGLSITGNTSRTAYNTCNRMADRDEEYEPDAFVKCARCCARICREDLAGDRPHRLRVGNTRTVYAYRIAGDCDDEYEPDGCLRCARSCARFCEELAGDRPRRRRVTVSDEGIEETEHADDRLVAPPCTQQPRPRYREDYDPNVFERGDERRHQRLLRWPIDYPPSRNLPEVRFVIALALIAI